jgi:hypothetical protein
MQVRTVSVESLTVFGLRFVTTLYRFTPTEVLIGT